MKSISALIVGVLIPLWVQAQSLLKPGTYRDLKPDKPIVLDTGTYSFINLEMKNLGKGIWLDSRKARSLILLHCTFAGDGKGTAVLSSGDLTVSKSTFTNMKTGIRSETKAGTTETVTLRGNQFADLSTAIELKRYPDEENTNTATVNFTLKCNEFINTPQTTTSFTRKGLVIGEGVQVNAPDGAISNPNAIGGSGEFNTTGIAYPNANVWPTAQVDRGERLMVGGQEVNLHDLNDGWANSPHWIAIDNQTGGQITYVRYNNEFVGKGDAILGAMQFPYPAQSGLKIATAGDGVTPGTSGYDFACGNFIDPQVVLFPARIAVVPADVTETKSILILDEALLNDAVPNPSQEESRIGLYVPTKAESATLQILETGTGKVLQNIPIIERGKLEVLLNTRKAPAAIYTYRLMVDGKPVGIKKLVVQH